MKEIVLNPTDMLVRPLPNYFTKESKFMVTDKAQTFNVGFIVHGGVEIPAEWIGKVVYYHSNMATEVNLKYIGAFELITSHTKLLIRLDQNEFDY